MPTPYSAIRTRKPATCPRCGCSAGNLMLVADDPSQRSDVGFSEIVKDEAEGCLYHVSILGSLLRFRDLRQIARGLTSLQCEVCGHTWPR